MKKQDVLTVLSVPVLLMLALIMGSSEQIQNHTALAWDGGYGYGWSGWHGSQSQWYQPVGCGSCNHQFGFGSWNVGYNAGYTDFSTNNEYDCGYNNGHSLTYCNGYQTGWNDAQNQNQNQDNQPSTTTADTNQDQQQYSTSYAQSNPNVHVTVNNIVPGTGNTDEGPGYTNK